MATNVNLITSSEGETAVTLTVNNESTNYVLSTGARGPAGASGAITSGTTSDGTAALYLDSIRFESSNGGPTQLGEMAWESTDGSIDAQLENGVIAAFAEDGLIRVRNTSGVAIAKGDALRFIGTVGASGRLEVGKWVGANVNNAKTFMGFAACAMNHNSNGYAQWFGKLDGIATTGGGEAWTDGQIIYAVPGASATITDTAPTAAGEYVVAAAVINAGSGTSGSLFVRPSFAKNIASADITDLATVDLPAVNTPLSDALDAKLDKASSITITGTTPAPTKPLIEIAPVNGKRSWNNDEGWEIYYDSGAWILSQNASDDYEATENSTTDEPWKLTNWNVNVGTGGPTLAIDPPDISPIGATGTRALTDRQDGKVNVTSVAGTLPVANGGTGGTDASTARTNLGLGSAADLRSILGIQVKAGTSTGLSSVGVTDITGLTGFTLEADTTYKLELHYLWTSTSSNFQIEFVTTGSFYRGGTTPALGQAMINVGAFSTSTFVNSTTFQLRGSVGENRTNIPFFGYAVFKTNTSGTGKLQLNLLSGSTLSTITSSVAMLTKMS